MGEDLLLAATRAARKAGVRVPWWLEARWCRAQLLDEELKPGKRLQYITQFARAKAWPDAVVREEAVRRVMRPDTRFFLNRARTIITTMIMNSTDGGAVLLEVDRIARVEGVSPRYLLAQAKLMENDGLIDRIRVRGGVYQVSLSVEELEAAGED